MLSELTPEEFEEWQDSDELDATVSGIDRLTWTLAMGLSILARREPYELDPAVFVPGQDVETPQQSIDEQKAICYRAAAQQRAYMQGE